MKQIIKRMLSLGMACLLFLLSGCQAQPAGEQMETTGIEAAAAEAAAGAGSSDSTGSPDSAESLNGAGSPAGDPTGTLPVPGDMVGGFTLDAVSESGILGAELFSFTHEKSGAQLLWVKNDDPELAFSISYHTPYVDETDTNHIFEHAIISGSEKYPSSNLFFDILGKSYSTFINAFTYNTFTTYPVSSESEEQFIKLLDVYLSCMVAPAILEDENIFKREALRYELYSPEDAIGMKGTVFSEDFAYLTDVDREAENNVADALYPGQYASNSIARAHRNYQNLSYEATLRTYERFYHFDNSLIFLYGDMDYEKILSFIDSEYLSKAEKGKTDLTAWEDPVTEDGYSEVTVAVPAYENDVVDNASRIDYAVSLEDMGWEDLLAWSILSAALNNENSVFVQNLRERGILNQAGVSVDLYLSKPYLDFTLQYAQPEQGALFQEAVLETLNQLAEEGMEEEILGPVLKQLETSAYLIRDEGNVGGNIYPSIVNYWTHTGRLDYYELMEQVLEKLGSDTEQEILRRLADEAVNAGRSVLVSSVPEPGLAEEILRLQEQYLADMKAAMSPEEIEALIQDTKEFDAWNASDESNGDFMIDPADIPDQEAYTDYVRTEGDGVSYYMAPVNAEKVGSYRLYFDLSDFSNEELMDLNLYLFFMGELGTEAHSAKELYHLKEEYLYSIQTDFLYPDAEAQRPMLRLSWISLTEDYEEGLRLLLELLGSTDFSDTEKIRELFTRYIDSYDVSRSGNLLNAARDLAASYSSRDYAYRNLLQGQSFYYYLLDTKEKLEQDESYGSVLEKRLEEIPSKLAARGRLIFACAAPEDTLADIRETSASLLESLPLKETDEVRVVLPESMQKQAIIVEASSQNSVRVGFAYEQEDFRGSYVPFLLAASDLYIVPKLRFQMGVYTAQASFSAGSGGALIASFSDPNAAETLEVFDGISSFISGMELTQEELNGYILKAISSSGADKGVFQIPLAAIDREITGVDSQKIADVVNDMKKASVEQQQDAAACFEKIFASGGTATLGNEAVLTRDQTAYDALISYKEKELQ